MRRLHLQKRGPAKNEPCLGNGEERDEVLGISTVFCGH